MSFDNRLRAMLEARRFAVTVELVTPARDRPLDEALAPALALASELAADPRVAAFTVTDRVRSDQDHDPVQASLRVARATGLTPLVHLSGKDRRPGDLAYALGGLAAAGIDSVLCVTGDRLKVMPADRAVPYVDSVEAIAITRRLLPDALVAGAISPFKYTEEELANQLFKMARKQAAGADVLITQVGWDMRRLEDLARSRQRAALNRPVIVNVMALGAGVARRLNKGGVPGVVVTDDLLAVLEFEAQTPDRGRAARLARLALQIVGAERLGHAGAQLSGLATGADVGQVLALADQRRAELPTVEAWWAAWDAMHQRPGGGPARLSREPATAAAGAPALAPADRRRYLALRAVHHVLFHARSPLRWALRPLARRVPESSPIAARLASLERTVKHPLVGCELCGTCRLPETFYVCPETCPKGLANGPCGGSTDNRCEAGDRECIHALVYRRAKAAGRLDELGQGLIPGAWNSRGTSSWLRFFAGRPPGGRGSE